MLSYSYGPYIVFKCNFLEIGKDEKGSIQINKGSAG